MVWEEWSPLPRSAARYLHSQAVAAAAAEMEAAGGKGEVEASESKGEVEEAAVRLDQASRRAAWLESWLQACLADPCGSIVTLKQLSVAPVATHHQVG
jgi:hypothetical protein